jgi:hypothetical protein
VPAERGLLGPYQLLGVKRLVTIATSSRCNAIASALPRTDVSVVVDHEDTHRLADRSVACAAKIMGFASRGRKSVPLRLGDPEC